MSDRFRILPVESLVTAIVSSSAGPSLFALIVGLSARLFLLLAVAGSAGHRRMKLVQSKRCVLIVGEYQAVPGPARLGVAGAARGTHLAGVRVGMTILAGLADVKQADLHWGLRRPAGMTLLAIEPGVSAHEREFAVAAVVEGQILNTG